MRSRCGWMKGMELDKDQGSIWEGLINHTEEVDIGPPRMGCLWA